MTKLRPDSCADAAGGAGTREGEPVGIDIPGMTLAGDEISSLNWPPDQPKLQELAGAGREAFEPNDAAGLGGTSEGEDEQAAARVFHVSMTVRAGGAVLALCAGMVNAISFYALASFVSHLTGSLSKVGIGLEDSASADAGHAALLVLSFVLGSALTGFLIAKDTIHFGLALYDLCLLSEAALLVCATLAHEDKGAAYLAAAACGLQNGMATHWGGAVVRTTHVTGLFTDVGLVLGRLLSLLCRKRCGVHFDDFDRAFVKDDLSKLSVLLVIALFFAVGVVVGACLHNGMEHLAFLVPAGITGGVGLMYLFYRVVVLRKDLFSNEEMEIIDVPIEIQDQVILEVQHDARDDSDAGSDTRPRLARSLSKESVRSAGVGRHDIRRPSKNYGVVTVSRDLANKLEVAHAGLDLHHQR